MPLVKYLLVVLVVAVVAWLWLRPRKTNPPKRPPSMYNDKASQTMVRCRHCGVHLPRSEALVDALGAYCSESHRLAGPRPE